MWGSERLNSALQKFPLRRHCTVVLSPVLFDLHVLPAFIFWGLSMRD